MIERTIGRIVERGIERMVGRTIERTIERMSTASAR
jgi:hypothetical protein